MSRYGELQAEHSRWLARAAWERVYGTKKVWADAMWFARDTRMRIRDEAKWVRSSFIIGRQLPERRAAILSGDNAARERLDSDYRSEICGMESGL